MGEASLDMLFKEVVFYLKPKFKIAGSYEAALSQLEANFKELAEKAKEVVPNATIDYIINKKSDAPSTVPPSALDPIKEEDDSQEDDEEAEDESLLGDEEEEEDTDENDEVGEWENDIDEEFDEEESVELNNGQHQPQPSKKMSPEEEEFQREFERMVNESMAARSSEVVRSNVEIAIPIQRETEKKSAIVANTDDSIGEGGKFSLSLGTNGQQQSAGEKPNDGTFIFRVMTRNTKSNKPQLKPVAISTDSELVQNFLAKQKAAEEEKKQYKQLILDINQRSELQQQNNNGDASPQQPNQYRNFQAGGHHHHHHQHQSRYHGQGGGGGYHRK